MLQSAGAATVTLGNNILAGIGPGPSTVTLEGASGGKLVLTGTISDPASGTGAVQALSSGTIEFEGANTYSGGTTLDFTTAFIGNDHGLGTGPLNATGSTLSFTSANPALEDPTLAASSLTFADKASITIVDMASDAFGSTNQINLGSNSSLSLQTDGASSYYGTITGTSSSIAFGSASGGVLDLYGANSYSGISTINSKTLVIADNPMSFGSSTIVLTGGGSGLAVAPGVILANNLGSFAMGATLSGYGTITPPSSPSSTSSKAGSSPGARAPWAAFPPPRCRARSHLAPTPTSFSETWG